MPSFKKKPVVIEAFQLPATGDGNVEPFLDWAAMNGFENFTSARDEGLEIETLEGVMRADPGDWIIKGVNGEFYPCKPDIFAKTYHDAKEKSGTEMLYELMGSVEDGSDVVLSLFQDDATKSYHLIARSGKQTFWSEHADSFSQVVEQAYRRNAGEV